MKRQEKTFFFRNYLLYGVTYRVLWYKITQSYCKPCRVYNLFNVNILCQFIHILKMQQKHITFLGGVCPLKLDLIPEDQKGK